MNYNPTICDFLEKNGISYFEVPNEINPVLKTPLQETVLSNYLYSVTVPAKQEIVSIANLCGSTSIDMFHPFTGIKRLIELFEFYFDRDGDGYHNRSVGILEYSGEEIIEQLKNSFLRDPIYFSAIEDQLYVSVNGNHRALVLLFHYLNCIRKEPEKEKEFSLKFQIPAKVMHLDLELSGIVYLLKMKHGSKFQMDKSIVKDGIVNFSIGQSSHQMSISEFRLFAKKEISLLTCTFSQFRDLLVVALSNSIADVHFKKAMNDIFDGFSNLNFVHLKEIMNYTVGIENELLNRLDPNLALLELIEQIRKIVFEVQLEALKKAIWVSENKERELEYLQREKAKIEKELEELDRKEKKAFFEDWILSMEPLKKMEAENYQDLEQKEQILKMQLSELQRKKIVLRKKKKEPAINTKLFEIQTKLDQPFYLEYQGSSISMREYGIYLKQAYDREKIDFYQIRSQLNNRLFDIEMRMIRLKRREDCHFNIILFQRFCKKCGFDFPVSFDELKITDKIEKLQQL